MIRNVDDSVSKAEVQGPAERGLIAVNRIDTIAKRGNTSKLGKHDSHQIGW